MVRRLVAVLKQEMGVSLRSHFNPRQSLLGCQVIYKSSVIKFLLLFFYFFLVMSTYIQLTKMLKMC